jgi:hypothetical protein
MLFDGIVNLFPIEAFVDKKTIVLTGDNSLGEFGRYMLNSAPALLSAESIIRAILYASRNHKRSKPYGHPFQHKHPKDTQSNERQRYLIKQTPFRFTHGS